MAPFPPPYLDVGPAVALLTRWGGPLLFAVMAAECIPLAGFAAPGLVVLVVAGFLAAGTSSWEAAGYLLWALSGVLVADTVLFALGRIGGERQPWLRGVIARHGRLRRELLAQPYPVLLLYQFPPYSRMFAPLVLGAAKLPWSAWLRLTIPAALLFVGSFFGLGSAAGLAGRGVNGAAGAASLASAVFALGFFAWLVLFILRVMRRRAAEKGAR